MSDAESHDIKIVVALAGHDRMSLMKFWNSIAAKDLIMPDIV